MKMRRVLTALLALVMVLSAVPFGAMAAGGDPAGEQGKLFLDKEAVLTDDGSYKIIMEAYATGKTTTQTIEKGFPLDIVLVIDQSGSMKQNDQGHYADGDKHEHTDSKRKALIKAAKDFVKSVYDNGQKFNVTHRIGIAGFASDQSGNTPWVNTGVYDNQGKFNQYWTKGNSGGPYESLGKYSAVKSQMLETGIYYVKIGSEYFEVTRTSGAGYVKVTNPDTSKKDYYFGASNGGAYANYGEYSANVEAINPTKGDGKTYYDANGNLLTWVEETKPDYVKVTSGDFNGAEYYIDTNKDPSKPNWVKLTWNGIGWTASDGKIYVKQTPKNGIYQFKRRKNYYDAYTMEVKPTGNWILSADGKTETAPVYEKVTRTGWNMNGTPVDTVYEKTNSGAPKWVYIQNGVQKDLTASSTIYQRGKLDAAVYHDALVPVADKLGKQTTSLTAALDALGADGATRIAYGVEIGNQIFQNNPLTEKDIAEKRQRVMIVFTDGQPGKSGYEQGEAGKAVNEAYKTKHTYNAAVYTIGLYDSTTATTEQTNFMDYLSSNYPDAKYQLTAKGRSKNENENDNEDEDKPKGSFNPGTPAAEKKYTHQVKNTSELNKIFQSIQQDISGSSTSVDLTTTSILRDIMAEGFKLTDKSVVTVSVIPGDATNAADESQIEWGTPTEVVTLTNPTDGKFVDGKYTDAHKPAHTMTIQASTHMANPDAGKKDLDTVDVTGFDYKDQYIAKEHKGSKLHVEITGVKALPTVANDQHIYTNHEQSGIWAPVTAGGERQFKAPFPMQPQTHMPSKSYVVDYAKPLDLSIADFKLTSAKNIDVDGYDPFAPAVTKVTHNYGKAEIVNNHLTYVPTTTNWDGFDTFYVFGTTDDVIVKSASANANGNVWSKVNVIPANNVYYEDTFVTNDSNGTVGITYTGNWSEIKEPEAGKNPGSETSSDNHGWIPVLENEHGDTDGSSHHGSFEAGNTATATFTFTGTGVDVYSRTNGRTGTVMAMLKDVDGKVILGKSVDTLSASGEYFQVPTLTFHEAPDGSPLPYGTYSVELRVTNGAKERMEYYLDGIRVYNPIKNGDPVVDDAYGPDELNAVFMEVRDMLLDANSFAPADSGVNVKDGFVFIDQMSNGAEGETDQVLGVGNYEELGPKNEVYLQPGQEIAFKVDTTLGNQFQVGLKALEGVAVTANISTAAGKQAVTLSHTADMYYTVSADTNGFITIANTAEGTALLSITKLKVTNPAAAVNTAAVFAETDVPTMLTAVQTFNAAPVVPETPVEPPVDPTEPDIDIENPEEKPERPSIFDILDKIFGSIFDWIKP